MKEVKPGKPTGEQLSQFIEDSLKLKAHLTREVEEGNLSDELFRRLESLFRDPNSTSVIVPFGLLIGRVDRLPAYQIDVRYIRLYREEGDKRLSEKMAIALVESGYGFCDEVLGGHELGESNNTLYYVLGSDEELPVGMLVLES